jgi:hypothetical protein
MSDCAQYQHQLAGFAAADAAGEPSRHEYDALRRHLAACAFCRAELARLLQVEAALRSWPLAPPPHDLVRPVMAQLAREPRQPDWRWLPWSVWLPALAIALALGMALAASVTGQPLPPASIAGPSGLGLALTQTSPLSELRQPLGVAGRELFWAIWCGLFLTLAGLGIGLGLATSRDTIDEVSAELRERWEHLREAVRL